MARTDNRPHCRSSATVLAWLFAAALIGGVPAPALAEVKPFSANFKARDMAVTGGTLHVRVGGSGPAVLLLHGFGDTGDMWQPLAEILVKDHTVIVPDLRGMGLSSHPEGGYEKASQARDIARILDELNVSRFSLVTHDIGVARLLAHRIMVMQRGRVVETGLTDQVLDDPQHPYTQLLVSSVLQA